MKKLCVIPARYHSSRFPGKPLIELAGKSLIRHVFDQVESFRIFNQVIVATDHQLIFDHCQKYGLPVEMTRDDHPSGTDRVAEVSSKFTDCEIVVNVQGDEPLIEKSLLEQIVDFLEQSQSATIVTAVAPMQREEAENPNRVKAVVNQTGKALYFSRSLVPYPRTKLEQVHYWRHIGTYGFLRKTLNKIVELPESQIEMIEGLEQLRWLDNGYNIHCIKGEWTGFGIDTPEDAELFLATINPL